MPECKVYLFGSRARNDNSLGADVDIALDAGFLIDSKIIYKIRDNIEESNIPLLVDLVDFYSTSGEFRNQIERDKILWEN